MRSLLKIYQDLLDKHGHQGWWPLLKISGSKIFCEYHPNDYSYPHNNEEIFEICLGAILTQNTSWVNVEKALINLYKQNYLTPKKIHSLDETSLSKLIVSAGCYNQKTRKLKIFTDFYLKLGNRMPDRQELLNLWGIGPETADSMLLYAFKIPTFVIDTYTKRFLVNEGLIKPNINYHELKELFEMSLVKDVNLFQEFHALIVAQAKVLLTGLQ